MVLVAGTVDRLAVALPGHSVLVHARVFLQLPGSLLHGSCRSALCIAGIHTPALCSISASPYSLQLTCALTWLISPWFVAAAVLQGCQAVQLAVVC
jgi:hypothetical protein